MKNQQEMSGFAYIDPSQALLELSLEALNGFAPVPQQTRPLDVPAVPCDLDESWKEFETELGDFKRKFSKEKRDLMTKLNELEELQRSVQISKLIIDTVPSEEESGIGGKSENKVRKSLNCIRFAISTAAFH